MRGPRDYGTFGKLNFASVHVVMYDYDMFVQLCEVHRFESHQTPLGQYPMDANE